MLDFLNLLDSWLDASQGIWVPRNIEQVPSTHASIPVSLGWLRTGLLVDFPGYGPKRNVHLSKATRNFAWGFRIGKPPKRQ